MVSSEGPEPLTLDHEAMRLGAYVPLDEKGFALPLYCAANRQSNAWYTATCLIDGDHASTISGFEPYHDEVDRRIHSQQVAWIGSSWQDVFLWRGQPRLGSPAEILAMLLPELEAMLDEAPLSLLGLLLAAQSPDTVPASRRARAFLDEKLGVDAGGRAYTETILRPGILLNIRRFLYSRQLPQNDRILRDFEILPGPTGDYQVYFGCNLSRELGGLEEVQQLAAAIETFARTTGDTIYLDEPAIQPQPSAAGEVTANAEPANALEGIDPIAGTGARRSRFFGIGHELAIDMGSLNTRLFARNAGSLINEKTMLAVRQLPGKLAVLATGNEAAVYVGREPENVQVINPFSNGAVQDVDMAVEFLRKVMDESGFRKRVFRPLDLVMAVPVGATSLERRTLLRVGEAIGASKVDLIHTPLAAAIGAGLPVSDGAEQLVIHLGASASEVALIRNSRIRHFSYLSVTGDKMVEMITSYMRRNRNLLVSPTTAGKILADLGAFVPPSAGEGRWMNLRGRDLINTVPKEIAISERELFDAITGLPNNLSMELSQFFQKLTTEEAEKLMDQGIVLTGGGALLKGIDKHIAHETGVPVKIAADPLSCVIRGLATAMNRADLAELIV